MHRQREGYPRHAPQLRQLGAPVEGRRSALQRRGEHGADREQQCVSVGGRCDHLTSGNQAVGARLVLDENRLPQRARHILGDGAGKDVGRAAGGQRYDEPKRAAGEIALRVGRRGGGACQGGGR